MLPRISEWQPLWKDVHPLDGRVTVTLFSIKVYLGIACLNGGGVSRDKR